MKQLFGHLLLAATFVTAGCGKEESSKSETNFSLGGLIGGVIGGVVSSQRLKNLSSQEERRLGRDIHKQFIESGQFTIYRNRALKHWVTQIGHRLVPYMKRKGSEFKDPKYYSFYVLDDNSPNAFATMGGHVYVTTGLLKFLETEAALAGAIGHELAHVDKKHALERMSSSMLLQGVLKGADLGNAEFLAQAALMFKSAENSREKEFEADKYGLKYLKRSSYAAGEMLQFFYKIKEEMGSSKTHFFSSHPSPDDRIDALKERLDPWDYEGDGMDKEDYDYQVCYQIRC